METWGLMGIILGKIYKFLVFSWILMTRFIYLFKRCDGVFALNIDGASNYAKCKKLETLLQETHKHIKASPSVLKEIDLGSHYDMRWVRDYKLFSGPPSWYPKNQFFGLTDREKEYLRLRLVHRGPMIPDGSPFGPLMASEEKK